MDKQLLETIGLDKDQATKVLDAHKEVITQKEVEHKKELEAETTKTRKSAIEKAQKGMVSEKDFQEVQDKYNALKTKANTETLNKVCKELGVKEGFEEDVIKHLDMETLDFEKPEDIKSSISQLLEEKPKYLNEKVGDEYTSVATPTDATTPTQETEAKYTSFEDSINALDV